MTVYGPTLGGGEGRYVVVTVPDGTEGHWEDGTPDYGAEIGPGGLLVSKMTRASQDSVTAPETSFAQIRGLDPDYPGSDGAFGDGTTGVQRDRVGAVDPESAVNFTLTTTQAIIVSDTYPEMYVPTSTDWPSGALDVEIVSPVTVTRMVMSVYNDPVLLDGLHHTPELVAVETERPADPADGWPVSAMGDPTTSLSASATTTLVDDSTAPMESRAFNFLNGWVLDGADKDGEEQKWYGKLTVTAEFTTTFPSYRFLFPDPAEALAGFDVPPLRMLPRSDGLGVPSARRVAGSRTIQGSLRRAGGTTF